MENKWSFPTLNNCQIRGLADAGITTFRGEGLNALTREVCQNSLDAIADGESTVEMEFEIKITNKESIPGYSDYLNHLNKMLEYWKDNSEQAEEYLKKAIKVFESRSAVVLRIGDYNTKGLQGPYDQRFGTWNTLTKIDGGATKSGDAGGSFGIGKNAPFECSSYRLVFYRTFNIDGEKAAQGISRLLSYPVNDKGDYTIGIGYFGGNNNGPVEKIDALDNLNVRDRAGTDVFVYGLEKADTGELKKIVFKELISNYLMSIYRGQLIVSLANETLSQKTLSKLITKYGKDRDTKCAWDVLNNNDTKEIIRDFHGMGNLKLRILVDHNKRLNKRVLVTRKAGMKLFLMNRISNTISFSGILELEGKVLNEYFREMENPQHNDWKSSFHSNPAQAQSYLNEIKEWIIQEVNNLGAVDFGDAEEVKGLGDVLTDMSNEIGYDDNKREGLVDHLSIVNVIQPEIAKSIHGEFVGSTGENQKKSRISKGTIGEGNLSAVRVLEGTRKRKKKQKHKGLEDKKGKDIVHVPDIPHGIRCPLEMVRVVKTKDAKTYKLSFKLPYDISSGHICINAIGENGKSNKIHINSAKEISNCHSVSAVNQDILFYESLSNEKVSMTFELKDDKNYAMEVLVYENN